MKKNFIASIILKGGKAVKSLKDYTVISENPTELAMQYNNGSVDGLLVFDLSDSDKEHEDAIDQLREICEMVRIPVIGAGNVKRMEDIKKLLYAGCKSAALNFSKPGNIELAKEVAEKFGRGNIAACCTKEDPVAENLSVIEKYVSTLIYVDDAQPQDVPEVEGTTAVLNVTELSDAEAPACFSEEKISGICGAGVNDNCGKIYDIKVLCDNAGIPVSIRRAAFAWSELKLDSAGLIPVVVQEDATDIVLMVAYMNEEAYNNTIRTGRMTYYSRSRKSQWVKGETSGHFQFVKSLSLDCDNDTLLARVDQVGAACHTGSHSCFFNDVFTAEEEGTPNPEKVLEKDYQTILDRKNNPKVGSYTNYLFDKGIDKMLKKLGEENTEIVIAAKNPNSNEIVYEIADYLYHMMVVMAAKNVTWKDVCDELARRQK